MRHAVCAYRVLIRAISEHGTDHLQRLAQQIFVSLLRCFGDGRDAGVAGEAAGVLLYFLELLENHVGREAFTLALQNLPALPSDPSAADERRGSQGEASGTGWLFQSGQPREPSPPSSHAASGSQTNSEARSQNW